MSASEPTFRDKYTWCLDNVPEATMQMGPVAEEIERLYAAAHPAPVTAEDVLKEIEASSPYQDQASLIHARWIAGTLAQREADRRNGQDQHPHYIPDLDTRIERAADRLAGWAGWDTGQVSGTISTIITRELTRD